MSYSYLVSYSTSATGPWTQAGTASTTSFSIPGLQSSVNYWVQVIAVDSVSNLQSAPTVGGPFTIGAVTQQESPDKTTVTAAGQQILSSQTPGQPAPSGGPFDTWTITAQGGQVVRNGTTDATTSNVMELYYTGHTVYQEESTGNSFGTPGWWQWTGSSSYPTATPGSGSFTDTFGNAWSLNSAGHPVINGVTDTASTCQAIYLVGSTIWQLDVTGAWYSTTPTGTISAAPSWTGPTTTSPLTNWAACASPVGVPLTINGISLSNNTVSNTAPAGTAVGTFNVTMSSGSFTGALSIGGANASSFQLSGKNLNTAAASLAAGNYSINTTATQSGVSNSPFGPTAFTIVSQASAGGPGPTASSPFITADFSSAFNYPNGSGQQIVSRYQYGYDSSSLSDNGWAAWSNNNITSALGIINPCFCEVKNAQEQWWNSDLSVNTAKMAPLLNNFYKADPLGIAGFFIGCNWDNNVVVSGTASPSQFATAMANLAKYCVNFTMPNGKKFPLVGVGGYDELDNEATSVSYYNAFGPAVKSAAPGVKIFGPVDSFFNQAQDFGAKVSSLDWFGNNNLSHWNTTGTNDTTPLTTDDFSEWGSMTNALSAGNIQMAGITSFSWDWDCGDGGGTIGWGANGAMYACKQIMQALDNARFPFFLGVWGGWGNGTCGIITDGGGGANPLVTPCGYFFAQGVRHVYGPRYRVPTNSTGMFTCAVVPTSGSFGLMVLNIGNGNKSGTVALSHWPVNSTGNGTANVWQMTMSQNAPGQDGTHSTVNVTAGVTSSITFPNFSITIISI
jgi:hypothetical protein